MVGIHEQQKLFASCGFRAKRLAYSRSVIYGYLASLTGGIAIGRNCRYIVGVAGYGSILECVRAIEGSGICWVGSCEVAAVVAGSAEGAGGC